MTLNGVMAVTLRYFTEFGKHSFHHNRRVDLWGNLCTNLLYFVLRAPCSRKESSRSLSHFPMSFLFLWAVFTVDLSMLRYFRKPTGHCVCLLIYWSNKLVDLCCCCCCGGGGCVLYVGCWKVNILNRVRMSTAWRQAGLKYVAIITDLL